MSSQSARLNKLERQPRSRARRRRSRPLNPIDFATSPDFLGQTLFPRQVTLLKILLLAFDLLTPFDLEVISGWAAGYTASNTSQGRRFTGRWGIVPDVLERMKACRDDGRWNFREVTLVLGRRASKSLMCSIVVAWQLWRLLMLQDPQERLGMQAGKKIMIVTFSTTRESIKRDLFGDLKALIQNAPCFERYIDTIGETSIVLRTPAQLRRQKKTGRKEEGLLEVAALATKASAARGPAVVMLVMDEAAHFDGSGPSSTSAEVRSAAMPAMAQYSKQACLMMPSTPWAMSGAQYEGVIHGTAVDENDVSIDPFRLVLQLPSWDLYLDYERATELEMWPGGPKFAPTPAPIIREDDEMLVSLRRENRREYEVEYCAQFVSGLAAYFDEDTRALMFGPYRGAVLTNRKRGEAGHNYLIHCDPSTSGANFAISVSHGERADGRTHIVVDYLKVYRPGDSDTGKVDYREVQAHLLELVDWFRPMQLSFDNHNAAFFTDFLDPAIKALKLQDRVEVVKVNSTQSQKFARYESLKSRANLGEIHIPRHPLAMEEALYLQNEQLRISHPTSGPCQTDDMIDAISWACYLLTQMGLAVFTDLAAIHPVGSPLVPGRPPSFSPTQQPGRYTYDYERAMRNKWAARARRQGHR